MAEALSIASSVIAVVQVAGKLGTSTLALKRLWDEVQDVPAGISICIEHLDMLTTTLDDMDGELQQTRDVAQNSNAGKKSLQYCHRVKTELEAMVLDMQQQIHDARKGKRTLTKFRVKLKKAAVEEYQQRMQYAIQLLTLAQQTYLIALTRIQPSIIMSEFTALQGREREEKMRSNSDCKDKDTTSNGDTDPQGHDLEICTSKSSLEHQDIVFPANNSWFDTRPLFLRLRYRTLEVACKSPLGGSENIRLHQTQIQLPFWISRKAWEIQAFKAYEGWKLQLKDWRIRPNDSDIFKYIENGQIDNVVQALRTHKASLYDISHSGFTLLDLAVLHENFDMADRLLDWGLRSKSIPYILSFHYTILRKQPPQFLDLYCQWERKYGNVFDVDISNCDFEDLTLFFGVSGYLVYVVESENLDFEQTVLTLIHSWSDWAWLNPAVMVDILTRSSRVVFAAIHKRALSSGTSIHLFLLVYINEYFVRDHYMDDYFGFWRKLVVQLFSHPSLKKALVDSPGGKEYTWTGQLCAVALRFLREGSEYTIIRSAWDIYARTMNWAIQTFLEDLNEAGVDLETFGRAFEAHVNRSDTAKGTTHLSNRRGTLIHLKYGARPEDWRFEWDIHVEDFAGKFWKFIEEQDDGMMPGSMPGAWVDYD